MPNGLKADILHEASALYRFVDFFEAYCKEQERSQTYGDPSAHFFHYVRDLTSGIKQLGKELGRGSAARRKNLRARLLLARAYMRVLHALIKPAADAHTLTIPAPLIRLVHKQLEQVDGMKDCEIVILLTSEFMYFQRPHTGIKERASRIERFIPKAKFPPKTGFIELPYSQGSSFFTNLAIYHEVGHFVYEELNNSPQPLIAALKSAKEECLNRASGRSRRDRHTVALASKTVEYWIQEIFCDLFAIRLVGPAFSFAIIEILGMLGFLDEKEKILTFDLEHPAPACRFAEHLTLLQKDSWWQALSDIKPSQKKLLQDFGKIHHSSYRFYAQDKTKSHSLITAFVNIVIPAIHVLISQVTNDPREAVENFKRDRRGIEDCFRVGVVPYTNDSNRGLDPVSIINSAFCFYLTELADVIEDFDGVKARSDVESYSTWARRLEMWTMKAIEDSLLQDDFRRNKDLWSSLEKKS